MMDDKQRRLFEENMRAIDEQSAEMAARSDTIATTQEIETAVNRVEKLLGDELANNALASKNHDTVSSGIANRRIKELTNIRSGLYDGTYDPSDIEDIIERRVLSIVPKRHEDTVPDEASKPVAPGTQVNDSIDERVPHVEDVKPVTDDVHDKADVSDKAVEKPAEPNDDSADVNGIDGKEASPEKTPEQELHEAEEAVQSDDAVPIDVKALKSEKIPRHSRKKDVEDAEMDDTSDGKKRRNPFVAIWYVLVNTAHEIGLITWPSTKTTVIMTLKVIAIIIVCGVALFALDYGASQLIGFLYLLRTM